jgi:hypothetical protein
LLPDLKYIRIIARIFPPEVLLWLSTDEQVAHAADEMDALRQEVEGLLTEQRPKVRVICEFA